MLPKSAEALDVLSPTLMAEARPRWEPAAGQAGARWGGFLVWPSLGVGAVLDSNPLQLHDPHGVAAGVRLTPRFVAERSSGVHATTIYGAADAILYPARPDADQLDGRVGVLHDWAPRRDLILRLQGDLAEARDRIDSRAVVTGSDRGRPFETRDATAAASVQKTFDRLFVSLGGDAVRSSFVNGTAARPSGAMVLSDQIGTEIKGRAGYWVGPRVFLFAEPAADWHVLTVGDDRSRGQRAVAGIGVDRWGLLGGELFAGAQRETYRTRAMPIEAPVWGGHLTWWPTPALTASVAFDRRLEQAMVGTAAQPLGSPLDVETETASLHYAVTRALSGAVNAEHAAIVYVGNRRTDDLLSVDGAVDYLWRHDLALTADLRLTRVRSTIAAASYQRATATVGALRLLTPR